MYPLELSVHLVVAILVPCKRDLVKAGSHTESIGCFCG